MQIYDQYAHDAHNFKLGQLAKVAVVPLCTNRTGPLQVKDL